MPIQIVVAVALLFDFMNGFHDSANSVATIVSTKVLRPKQAVLWAAFFNFIALFFFGLTVAKTIGEGLVDPSVVTVEVIFAALSGAIVWDWITWFFGLPSSSMHALVGGLAGAVVVEAGFAALKAAGFIRILFSIFLSPLLGLILSFSIVKIERKIFTGVSPERVDKISRRLQLCSAALYSLAHGGNDAQKTMGVITVLLFASHRLQGAFHVPFWVVIACHSAMALGTYFGGSRIIRTMGEKMVKLTPETGCCAETGGAITVFLSTRLGIPISTTHTIAGAITGVGVVDSAKKVNWPIIRRIFWGWILTVPASGLTAALIGWVIHAF